MSSKVTVPNTSGINLLSAIAYIAHGKFLTLHDDGEALAEIFKGSGWLQAQQRLFVAHVDGKLTLYGRVAPSFGAKPNGEMIAIPQEFFLDSVAVGLSDYLYHPTDALRIMYYDVRVKRLEFAQVFTTPDSSISVVAVTADESVAPTKKYRAWTSKDQRDLKDWAIQRKQTCGISVSQSEAYSEFSRPRQLGRDGSRTYVSQLPAKLRRPAGGAGQTKQLKGKPSPS